MERASPSLHVVGIAPQRLTVRLLGGFELLRDGHPVDLARWQRRPAALLRLLAASGGRVSRDEVIELFWPESDTQKGATNLRQVLYQLRRELGANPPPVTVKGGWLTLNPHLDWEIDLVKFQTAVATAGDNMVALEAALDLYGGEPLPEDRYEDWAAPIREHISQTYRAAALCAARLRHVQGAADQALRWVAAVTAADPLDEAAVRLQLELLVAMGRRTDALQSYTRFKDRLVGELGLEPDPQTLSLVEEIRHRRGTLQELERAGAPQAGHPVSGTIVDRPGALSVGGFLGALPVGDLIHRQRELDVIQQAIAGVSGGGGRLILLAGEAGVGKTRLAQEVTREVWNGGFLLATGRCHEPQQNVPFYPLLEALTDAYRRAPSSVRHEVSSTWPYLARLLPDEVPLAGTLFSIDRLEQQRLFWSVSGFLRAIAEQQPVALLLDDLQWADGTSLELFAHLARHTRGHRVLILGTYRVSWGKGDQLDAMQHDLDREQLLERIDVRPLGPEGTIALATAILGDELPPELGQLLHRRTEGNAFFIQQTLRMLTESGGLYRDGERWSYRTAADTEIPRSIRSLVGQRISRLPEEARGILFEASVLGQTFAFDDLLVMAQRQEATIDEALEVASAAGLLQPPVRGRYAFDHVLTQQTLYAELSPRRRRSLHRAAGAALEGRRGVAAAELVWHFLQGEDAERALLYSVQAGAAAERVFAHDDAERHYRTALHLARDQEDQDRVAQVAAQLGEVLRVEAHYDEALNLLEEAASIYQAAGEVEQELRVGARIGRVHFYRGSVPEGIARLQALLDGCGSCSSSSALAALHASLAALYWVGGRYVEQLRAAERAGNAARVVGDEVTLAEAEWMRGHALVLAGQDARGLVVLEELIPLAERIGDLHNLCFALNAIGCVYENRGQFVTARVYAERALAAAQQRGDPGLVMHMTARAGMCAFFLGDWAEARQFYDRAVRLTREVGTFLSTVWPLVDRGRLHLYQGEWDAATGYAEEVIAIAEAAGHLWPLTFAWVILAERDLLQGRPAAARDALQSILAHRALNDAQANRLRVPLVQAYVELGELRAAESVVRTMLEHADPVNERVTLVEISRVAAANAAATRRWDEASRFLQDGLALAADMAYPLAEARLLQLDGLVRLRQGERQAARHSIRAARAIFERLEARPFVERSEAILAGLEEPEGTLDRVRLKP